MLGYSMAFNVSQSVETPLFARTFVLKDKNQKKVAIVECELCFIPSELKTEVVYLLQKELETQEFNEENVLIMAQHTHSAHGGYCHYSSYYCHYCCNCCQYSCYYCCYCCHYC